MGYLCANIIFLGLSVLDLGPMYATDRQTDRHDVRQTLDAHHRLMPPPYGAGHNNTVESAAANFASVPSGSENVSVCKLRARHIHGALEVFNVRR